ncbi:hypothetical protein [Streptomyces sp. PA5.6]|uniref:hypothetical protein n=1 Tax=Streptomyces sp. PA5.6 TaxID=3035651 RepID=UPI0039047E7E
MGPQFFGVLVGRARRRSADGPSTACGGSDAVVGGVEQYHREILGGGLGRGHR